GQSRRGSADYRGQRTTIRRVAQPYCLGRAESHHVKGAAVLGRGTVTGEDQWTGGWLCPTRADRLRLVEMNQSVRRARILVGAMCGIGVAAMSPWVPAWSLALFALAPGPLLVLDRLLARSRRPERLIAGSLTLHATLILTGVAVTGGIRSPILPWVAIPVVTA